MPVGVKKCLKRGGGAEEYENNTGGSVGEVKQIVCKHSFCFLRAFTLAGERRAAQAPKLIFSMASLFMWYGHMHKHMSTKH